MPPAPGTSGDLPPGYLTDDAKQQRRASERRKKRLMLGLGVLVVIGAVLATVVLTADSNKKETVASLEVGQCFTGDPNDVQTVDCTEPHQFELFAVAAAPDPAAAFPGPDTVLVDGGSACTVALVGYYGAATEVFVANGLELEPIVPTEDQWNDGQTDSYCLAKDADGDALDRSVAGQGAG